jgi:D-arabinose 1-dehydrogenase-like Zn-dependent alcohol dehydrogenase
VWNKLSKIGSQIIYPTSTEITLNELSEKIDLMLNGKLKGRTVINMELKYVKQHIIS